MEKIPWKGVVETLERKYDLKRKKDCVRCFWGRLARETKVWLSVESSVLILRPSRTTTEDERALAMNLYKSRLSEKGSDSVRVFGAPLKFIEAAEYL